MGMGKCKIGKIVLYPRVCVFIFSDYFAPMFVEEQKKKVFNYEEI